MRLAAEYDRIHSAGAELAAVSVDDEVRQAGMVQRWKLTHTRMVADPGGETYLRPLGLYDPEERDGIALPGMIVVTLIPCLRRSSMIAWVKPTRPNLLAL